MLSLLASRGTLRCQELSRPQQRTGTMANAVFDFVGEFGKGLVVTLGNEEGIVAEAAGAARFEDNHAFARAFGEVENCAVRTRDRNCGDEARATIATIDFREFGEK